MDTRHIAYDNVEPDKAAPAGSRLIKISSIGLIIFFAIHLHIHKTYIQIEKGI